MWWTWRRDSIPQLCCQYNFAQFASKQKFVCKTWKWIVLKCATFKQRTNDILNKFSRAHLNWSLLDLPLCFISSLSQTHSILLILSVITIHTPTSYPYNFILCLWAYGFSDGKHISIYYNRIFSQNENQQIFGWRVRIYSNEMV